MNGGVDFLQRFHGVICWLVIDVVIRLVCVLVVMLESPRQLQLAYRSMVAHGEDGATVEMTTA